MQVLEIEICIGHAQFHSWTSFETHNLILHEMGTGNGSSRSNSNLAVMKGQPFFQDFKTVPFFALISSKAALAVENVFDQCLNFVY